MTNSLRQILSFIRDPHPNEEREVENQWSILMPQSSGTLGVCHMCYVYIRMFLIIGKTIIFGIFHKTKFESKRAEFKTSAKTLKNFKSLKCERIKNDWLLCLFWTKPVLELLITKMRKNDCLFCLFFFFFLCVFTRSILARKVRKCSENSLSWVSSYSAFHKTFFPARRGLSLSICKVILRQSRFTGCLARYQNLPNVIVIKSTEWFYSRTKALSKNDFNSV